MELDEKFIAGLRILPFYYDLSLVLDPSGKVDVRASWKPFINSANLIALDALQNPRGSLSRYSGFTMAGMLPRASKFRVNFGKALEFTYKPSWEAYIDFMHKLGNLPRQNVLLFGSALKYSADRLEIILDTVEALPGGMRL